MELVIALVVLAVGFAAVYLYQRIFRRRYLDWSKLAQSIGFSFFPGSEVQWPMMRGDLKGFEIRLTAEPGDPSIESSASTRAVVFLDFDLPAGFFVARRGKLGTLENIFTMERLEIGDPEIDSLLLIKGRDEDKVFDLMADTGVRRALAEFFELYPTAQITSDAVSVILPSLVAELRDVREVVDEVLRVADILEEAVRISVADEGTEGRRSSLDTQTPEVRYAQTPLSSLYDDDLELKGESSPEEANDDETDSDSETPDEGDSSDTEDSSDEEDSSDDDGSSDHGESESGALKPEVES